MSKEDFYDLTPDEVLNVIETQKMQPTGEFYQLNSYENRVFDVRLEGEERVIIKFYRPGRWNLRAILEEHDFLNELRNAGWPTVAPMRLLNDSTVDVRRGIFYTCWPRALGRQVTELQTSEYQRLGRVLAHLHNIGAQKRARYRPVMNAKNYGWDNLNILGLHVAPEVQHRYFAAAETICDFLEYHLDERMFIRIHGDCHKGNLLRVDQRNSDTSEFFFIDFDDFCTGHPIQDFWMLLSAPEDTQEGQEELMLLCDGYGEFRHFHESWINLITPLRGLRIINYAAWIARRWDDPTFPQLFPQYVDYNYWAAETESLEKIAHHINSR